MARLTPEIESIKQALYLEIEKADRTGASLMMQGYLRPHVQYCMPMLIKAGVIFKHGVGKNTYYSVNKSADSKKVDPIILPPYDEVLAFRMGYAMHHPSKGRVIKGVML